MIFLYEKLGHDLDFLHFRDRHFFYFLNQFFALANEHNINKRNVCQRVSLKYCIKKVQFFYIFFYSNNLNI